MTKQRKASLSLLPAALLLGTPLLAHVPYVEVRDYTGQRPFVVNDSVENSKAVYAWFSTGADVDVYTFELTAPTRLYAEAIVPVCPGYEDLLPWLAIVGPGLSTPDQALPFELPAGYGAIVVENTAPGEPRETFYEAITGKSYYEGPVFDETLSEPGTWYLYYWDPYGLGGDYAAVIGYLEVFSPADLARSALWTPYVRADRELHVDCP